MTKICRWWWQHQWGKWIHYGQSGSIIHSKRVCSICNRVDTRTD